MLPAPLPTLKVQFAKAEDPIWLYGNVTSTNEPLDEPLIGIYRYQLNASEPNREKIHIDMDLRGFYGNAGWHPDGYHIVEIEPYSQTYTHHLYDLNTWERVHSKVGDYYSQFNSAAWDWVENKQAVLAMSDSAWAIHDFAHFLEMENFTRTKGHPLVLKGAMLRAIAIDTDGAIFGIDYRGYLYSINRHNGNLKFIGNTGKPSPYDTSMYIDPLTHKLYYVCNNQTTDMYILDTETAQPTYLWKFPFKEQIFGLFAYTPMAYDKAPAAPENLNLNFDGASLDGKISFSVPAKLFDGSAASGQIDYKIKIDRKTVASGKAAFGSTVEVPVTVDTTGYHTYVAVLENSVGTSPYGVKEEWTGLDYVNSVKDPRLIYLGNNKVRVQWNKCDLPQHGGYMPASEVTYDVIRYPGAVEVATGLKGTSFEETVWLESDQPMSCSYAVRSNVRDAKGTYTETNKIIVGAATPPYSFKADTEANSMLFTPIDADNDGFTWQWYVSKMICYYNPYVDRQRDDWLITAPIKVTKGTSYKVHLSLTGHQSDLSHEVSLWGGVTPTAEGMTKQFIPSTSFATSGGNTKDFDVWITPDVDGIYYLGLHTTSESSSYYLYLNDFTISTGGNADAPAPIEDLLVYTHDDGGAKAYIGFTTPTETLSGSPLAHLDSVTIYRGENLVVKLEVPQTGKKYALDETLKRTGTYDYTIRAYNKAGSSLPYTLKAYIGNTTPGNVPSAEAAFDADGTLVSWTIPTTSVSGAPINPNMLSFSVSDEKLNVLQDNIVGTETILPNTDVQQQFMQYLLKAKLPGGFSDRYTHTNPVPVGIPYSLPFNESVSRAEMSKIWKIYTVQGNSTWRIAEDGGDINSSDGDGGFLYYQASQLNAESRLTGGRIAIPNVEGENIEVSLDYYCMADAYNQLVVQINDGNGWHDVLTIDLWKGIDGTWNTAKATLPESLRGKTVQIGILGRCLGDTQSFADNLAIHRSVSGVAEASEDAIGPFRLSSRPGQLDVFAPADAEVKVYSLEGILCGRGSGKCSFRLPNGMYVVKCQGNMRKIIIG